MPKLIRINDFDHQLRCEKKKIRIYAEKKSYDLLCEISEKKNFIQRSTTKNSDRMSERGRKKVRDAKKASQWNFQ